MSTGLPTTVALPPGVTVKGAVWVLSETVIMVAYSGETALLDVKTKSGVAPDAKFTLLVSIK